MRKSKLAMDTLEDIQDNVVTLPQHGGKVPFNWLMGLEIGTRFLATERRNPRVVLDDCRLIAKGERSAFLKENINFYENREYREYWVNSEVYSNQYILFEILEIP